MTHELRMYQERIGILHLDEEVEKKADDDLHKQMGIKLFDNAQVNTGSFDYITPLLLSYKHKIQSLDKHVNLFPKVLILYVA